MCYVVQREHYLKIVRTLVNRNFESLSLWRGETLLLEVNSHTSEKSCHRCEIFSEHSKVICLQGALKFIFLGLGGGVACMVDKILS